MLLLRRWIIPTEREYGWFDVSSSPRFARKLIFRACVLCSQPEIEECWLKSLEPGFPELNMW